MIRPVALAAAVGALVIAGAVGLVACGVPLDDQPRAITQTTPATVAATPTTAASTDAQEVSVYFLRGERLERVGYPVTGEPTLRKALDFVLSPLDKDADPALHTAIPPGTQLNNVEVTDGVATIDLTSEINDVKDQTQKQAFAQIVFTTLSFEGAKEVRFLVDGDPVDAPTDDGNLPTVTADDYDKPLNPR